MPSDYALRRKHIRARGLPALVTRAKVALSLYTQPDPSRVLGIDTSHWTGVVDFARAAAAGIRFVIIKFMDGKLRTRYAEENYRGAVDAGLLVGAYQWLRHHNEVSPGGQAREYQRMLRDHPVHIRPAVDFEWSPAGKALNAGLDDLHAFVQVFADNYGSRPMLYTAAGYWTQYGSTDPFWASLMLWQARYGTSWLPMFPWDRPTFWQFTETGEGARYGVPPDGEKAVDLNYFNGNYNELRQLCGLAPIYHAAGTNDRRLRR